MAGSRRHPALEQATGHEAGVVDEQVHVRQRRGAPSIDSRSTGRARRPAPRGRRRRRRGRLEAAGVAHAVEEQVEPAGGELGQDRAADAAVRAGDECCESVQVHRSRVRGAARKRMTSLNHIRRGRGEPLLLIHPLGADIVVWEPVLDTLAAQREVIAVDMPGFGTSPPLRTERPQRRMHWPPPWRASSTRSGSSACTWRATRWAAGWRSSWRRRAGRCRRPGCARPVSGRARSARAAAPTCAASAARSCRSCRR